MKNTPEYGTPVAVEIDGHAFFGVVLETISTTGLGGTIIEAKIQLFDQAHDHGPIVVGLDHVLCELGTGDIGAAILSLESYKWATDEAICRRRGTKSVAIPVPVPASVTTPDATVELRTQRAAILADPTLAGAGFRFLVDSLDRIQEGDDFALISSFTPPPAYWAKALGWMGSLPETEPDCVFRRPIAAEDAARRAADEAKRQKADDDVPF